MNKHTPGPWNMDGPQIVGSGYGIGHVTVHNTTEGKSNALIFTAAPDLLEALEYCLDCLGDEFALPADCQNTAIAAIAKARGTRE